MAKKGAARKGEVNRTEVVRKYMTENPTKSNTEIQRELEDQGTVVSGSLVSQVRKEPEMPKGGGTKKKAAKKKAGKKKTAKKQAATATQAAKAPTGGQAITADELYDAKQLADELGGIDRLREALNALERLR